MLKGQGLDKVRVYQAVKTVEVCKNTGVSF
jgi:hypothetical protein